MAKQLWHTNEFNTELKDVPLLNTGECTIKSLFSFISAGTESLVISRSIPLAAHDFMKVPFMEGSFNLPCTYGYSLVGALVSAQPSYPINSLVYLMHPHQDSIAVPAQSLTLIQSLPPKRATLIANMETALNACWDGQIQHGSKVLIAGYGIIGALVARVLKAEFNCNVSVAEINESRIDLLKQHGYDLDVNSIATYDIVFNTAANEKALQCCIEKLNKNGTLIELSWYGNKSVQLDLGAHFHFNRIKLLSSQVSTISEHAPEGCTFEQRKQMVIEILKDDFYDQIITNEIPFSAAPEFFNQLRTSKALSGLGYVINYNL